MDTALLFSLLTAGAAAGAGCGITCSACGSPMVNLFMASYLFTHGKKLRYTLLSLAKFYIGKMCAVVILCVAASLAGSKLMDDYGNIGGVDIKLIVQILLVAIMILQIILWIRNYKKDKKKEQNVCEGCRERRFEKYPMFIYGFIGGVSPCTPLFLILTYTAGVTPAMAAVAGAAFSIANSLIPVLVLSLLTGALSERMLEEIPGKVKYIQIAVYVIFLVIAGVGVVKMTV